MVPSVAKLETEWLLFPRVQAIRIYDNLIKQLFHSRFLDMRLVITNSAIRASLAIYQLISNARLWNNCMLIIIQLQSAEFKYPKRVQICHGILYSRARFFKSQLTLIPD